MDDIEGIKEDLVLTCARLTKNIARAELLVNLNCRDQEQSSRVAAFALKDESVQDALFGANADAVTKLFPFTASNNENPSATLLPAIRETRKHVTAIFVRSIHCFDQVTLSKNIAKEILEFGVLDATDNAANNMMIEVDNMLKEKETNETDMTQQFAKFKLWLEQEKTDNQEANGKCSSRKSAKNGRGAQQKKNGKRSASSTKKSNKDKDKDSKKRNESTASASANDSTRGKQNKTKGKGKKRQQSGKKS